MALSRSADSANAHSFDSHNIEGSFARAQRLLAEPVAGGCTAGSDRYALYESDDELAGAVSAGTTTGDAAQLEVVPARLLAFGDLGNVSED